MDLANRLRLWNPWWEDIKPKESFINRAIVDEVLKYAEMRKAKVLTGVRRSGKTTVMKLLIYKLIKEKGKENILYVDMEDPFFSSYTIEDIVKEYIKLMKPSSPFIFIDEVQSVERWSRYVKLLLDREGFSVFLSGSTSSLLKGEHGRVLGGRALEFTVYPLSYKEMVQNLNNHSPYVSEAYKEGVIDDYLAFGGFPEVVIEEDKEKKLKLLLSYVESIAARDIADKIGESYGLIMEALKYVISTVGGLTSINKLRKALKISYERGERIYRGLVESYAVIVSPFYSKSVRKREAMHKKLYPIDVGFFNVLSRGEDKGKRLESFVVEELVKNGYEVFYYMGKKECDIIAVKGEKVLPLQVTWEERSSREIEGLKEAEKAVGKEGLIITRENVREFLESIYKTPTTQKL